MKELNFFSLRKCGVLVAMFCLLSPRIWGQTTIAGGNNAAPVVTSNATRDSKESYHVKAVYPVTKDVFHQKANELNETISAGDMNAANSKFNETLALMNSHLAYLDEKTGSAGANDKAKWTSQMKKAKDAYFAIISFHEDLPGNKTGLGNKLSEFERTIN